MHSRFLRIDRNGGHRIIVPRLCWRKQRQQDSGAPTSTPMPGMKSYCRRDKEKCGGNQASGAVRHPACKSARNQTADCGPIKIDRLCCSPEAGKPAQHSRYCTQYSIPCRAGQSCHSGDWATLCEWGARRCGSIAGDEQEIACRREIAPLLAGQSLAASSSLLANCGCLEQADWGSAHTAKQLAFSTRAVQEETNSSHLPCCGAQEKGQAVLACPVAAHGDRKLAVSLQPARACAILLQQKGWPGASYAHLAGYC